LLEAPAPQSSSVPFDVDPAVISINEGGVVNGASFAKGGKPTHAAAPGSIVTIFGAGFAHEETSAPTIPLPASLGGVSVTLNGQPAPLLFVGPGQINAQVPWNLLSPGAGSGQVAVVVARNGASSVPMQAPVQGISPAIFTLEFGSGPAVAINPDGSLAQPAGSIPGLATRPATAGSWITILATGLGAVDDDIEDGENSLDRLRETLQQPRVKIGGREARVLFSGLSPQFVAVYQVNAELPLNVTEGDAVPVQLELEGIATGDDVTIAVRR
jgi:uncharacterized protein (TIGR03437 family)